MLRTARWNMHQSQVALKTIPAVPGHTLNAERHALALFAPLRNLATETAMFAYLDPKWRLLAVRTAPSDCVDMVEVPIRTIVSDALALDASGVVMAHNHPSGNPVPSDEDRALTRRLARALDGVTVRLVDHLVLAGPHTASFRRIGLL